MSQSTSGVRNNRLVCRRRRRRNSSGRYALRRLRIEPLERRLLLSAGTAGDRLRAIYDADTRLLTVLGTELSDAALVWADAEGAVSVESPPGTAIQICDPQGEPAEPTLDELDSLLVDLYGGDDHLAVGYHTAERPAAGGTDVEPSPFRRVDGTVFLGEGDDTLQWNTVAASPAWHSHVAVYGGQGSDTLTVFTPPPGSVDRPPRAAPLQVQFDSGPGQSDAIEVFTTDADEHVTVVGSIRDDVPGGRQFLIDVRDPLRETLVAELTIYTPTRVAADTGGGDDVVEIHGFENDFAVGSLFDTRYDVDLGEGDNLLTLDGKGNDVAVQVRSGAGADEVIIRAKPVPASPAGMAPGRLTAELDLGGGDDVARVRTLDDDVQVDSFFDIRCDIDLGEGDNLATLDGKGNDVAVQVRSGAGADEVIIRAKPVPASPAGMAPGRLTAELDLGGGDDVARVRTLDDDVQVDSFFDIRCDVDLGEGDNLLTLDGKGNDIAVRIRSGSGADEVIVRAKPVPASPAGMAPGRLAAEIDLGDGNDVASCSALLSPPQVDLRSRADTDVPSLEGSILVVAGGGDDRVALELAGVLDAAMHVGLLGQGGRDDLSVDASQLDIGRGGVLSMGLHGGNGDDRITFCNHVAGSDAIPPRVEGRLRLHLSGGRGKDTIAAQLADRALRTGSISVKVMGGPGDDLLTLLAEGVAGRFRIDGGPGDDKYTASGNVQVRHCEGLIGGPIQGFP